MHAVGVHFTYHGRQDVDGIAVPDDESSVELFVEGTQTAIQKRKPCGAGGAEQDGIEHEEGNGRPVGSGIVQSWVVAEAQVAAKPQD